MLDQYSKLLEHIDESSSESESNDENVESKEYQSEASANTLFTVDGFINDLKTNSCNFTKDWHNSSIHMNAYDIASNCIREIIFKLLHYPIKDYSAKWLPILMRAKLGNAVHKFIQDNSTVFTEQECSLKVPSIRVSGRLDCLINNNVLVEIKSCTYDDYHKILRDHQPRNSDFYQAILYKYLLENHLEEIKNQPRDTLRSDPPKLDLYNIDTIQFIYVAHNVFSQSVSTVSDALKQTAQIKKALKSRYNKFHFIAVVNIDLNTVDLKPYIDAITFKINEVNEFVNANKLPSKSHSLVKNNCFFCLYNSICKQHP